MTRHTAPAPTARPWQAANRFTRSRPSNHDWTQNDSFTQVITTEAGDKVLPASSENEAKANVAHIVRCVNSHDRLVEVLRWALNADEMLYCDCYLSEGVDEETCTGKCVYAACVAALAEAEKE